MLAMRPATGTPSMAASAGSNGSVTAMPTVTDAVYESAPDCAICDKKFHAFRRKHRCRSCGNAVCGSCARNHKLLPTSAMQARYSNEPVRVCDRCIQGQTQMMQERRRTEDIERARARQQAALHEERIARMLEQSRLDEILAEQLALEERQKAAQLRLLERKHFGARPERPTIRRRRSMDDVSTLAGAAAAAVLSPLPKTAPKDLDVFLIDAEKRALEILDMANIKHSTPEALRAAPQIATITATVVREAMVVPEADECAICLDTMDVGHAIYTTACRHSFHWRCLKDIQQSDASNADKCPSCRATMEEMQVKKVCDHPRVRLGHRFCRDCGHAVTERDAKPRPNDDLPVPPPGGAAGPGLAPPPTPPTSYRASSHGALVRCPQCQIQMRVLPHMYNMRVACPSGHMFLVQVAGQTPPQTGPQGGVMPFGGRVTRGPPRGAQNGYPGSASYYQRPANYSEL